MKELPAPGKREEVMNTRHCNHVVTRYNYASRCRFSLPTVPDARLRLFPHGNRGRRRDDLQRRVRQLVDNRVAEWNVHDAADGIQVDAAIHAGRLHHRRTDQLWRLQRLVFIDIRTLAHR